MFFRRGAEREHSIKLSLGTYSVPGKRFDKYSPLPCGQPNRAEGGTRGNLVLGDDRWAPRQPARNPQSGRGGGGHPSNPIAYRRGGHRARSKKASDLRGQPAPTPTSFEREKARR